MISVVIPVYNAENYVSKAIMSALDQEEVSEVVVVDDGSSDQSLNICQAIAKNAARVKIFTHDNHVNLGRSHTRNLGIKKANGKYIGFLDADDFYLPNRFSKDIAIFESDIGIDGVYNAISAHFYRAYTEKESKKLKLTTVREKIPSENLFELMGPIGHMGYFSGIGLTVRKNIFDKVGWFNENLVVAEDTELWLKMSLKAKLIGGILQKPVSMRGVHFSNVSFKEEDLYNRNFLKMYISLYEWSKRNNLSLRRLSIIWKKIWVYRRTNKTGLIDDVFYWIIEMLKAPKMLLFNNNYKTFPIFWRLKKHK